MEIKTINIVLNLVQFH